MILYHKHFIHSFSLWSRAFFAENVCVVSVKMITFAAFIEIETQKLWMDLFSDKRPLRMPTSLLR